MPNNIFFFLNEFKTKETNFQKLKTKKKIWSKKPEYIYPRKAFAGGIFNFLRLFVVALLELKGNNLHFFIAFFFFSKKFAFFDFIAINQRSGN